MNCGYKANGSLIRNDAGWSLLKSPNFWHCIQIRISPAYVIGWVRSFMPIR
jgi:hypothetical protein